MGQITKRGEYQWRAKVRRKGFPEQSRTFTYREDAEKWVRMVESELETTGFIDRREADKNTLAEVLQRYQREITPSKKSAAMRYNWKQAAFGLGLIALGWLLMKAWRAQAKVYSAAKRQWQRTWFCHACGQAHQRG